jgi:hypothetical protein
MRKLALTVLAFAAMSGAIAWGVLADARETRLLALLSEIEAAETGVAYAGVREIEAGGPPVALRVQSAGDGRRQVERLKPGAPRARAGLGLLRPGFAHGPPRVKDFALAVRNYDIAAAGRDVVAGRAADVWEVRPKHPGRPSYRVAADSSTRLALRFEVFDAGGNVFRAEFKEIDFEPDVAAMSFPAPPALLREQRRQAPPEELPDLAGFEVWTPARVPAGFALRGSGVLRVRAPLPLAGGGTTVAHLDYTDGLAAMSVVQVSTQSELYKLVKRFLPGTSRASEGFTAHRFAGRAGAAYVMELDGTAVLVAGNVGPSELEPVIRSLERRKQ